MIPAPAPPSEKSSASERIELWQPPAGWIEVRAGVFEPANYRPSTWEIPASRIATREQASEDYAKCVKSLAYFGFHHCWTVDVDDPEGASIRKLPAYPYLRRFFSAMQDPRNTLVEKSRQLTMSWAQMVVFLWDILFHNNWPDLVLSKRAKDVDDGGINSTPDSNLGKLRFLYNHLPYHLWQPFEIKAYKIRNIARNSHVTGETGVGGKASRGQTYLRALADEAAYIDRGEQVFKGLRQAAKEGTILQSTPNGKGNVFARIRHQADTTFQKLSFHWSEHPRKADDAYCACGWHANPESPLYAHEQYTEHRAECPLPEGERKMRSPWYDNQARDMLPEDVASELDISYERSQRGRVWFNFDSAKHTFRHTELPDPSNHGRRLGERRVTESEQAYRLRYLRAALDPTLQPVVGWDFGVNPSATAMVLGQVFDEERMRIRWLDIYVHSNYSYKHYGQFFLDVWRAIWAELRGFSFYSFAHYGDPAGSARGSDLTSWISNLALPPYEIQIQPSPIRKGQSKADWLDFVNDRYDGHETHEISTYATLLIDTMEQYQYPVDENGRPIVGKQEPVHNEWSHPADAKRYVHQGRWPHRLRVRSARAAAQQSAVVRSSGRGSLIEVREW